MSAKKCKIEDENRIFNSLWENEYLFIINKQKKTSMFSLFKYYCSTKRI
jgi:hypothetical protein